MNKHGIEWLRDAPALGLVRVSNMVGRVGLFELIGHFVLAGVHLFGALFLKTNYFFQQGIAFACQLGALSTIGGRPV